MMARTSPMVVVVLLLIAMERSFCYTAPHSITINYNGQVLDVFPGSLTTTGYYRATTTQVRGAVAALDQSPGAPSSPTVTRIYISKNIHLLSPSHIDFSLNPQNHSFMSTNLPLRHMTIQYFSNLSFKQNRNVYNHLS